MPHQPYVEPLTDDPTPPGAYVRVIVVDVAGSTPADAGATMLVTAEGLHAGTVGGGRIEARAIQEAQALLGAETPTRTRFVAWNLHRDIGMTCGGTMKLYFERCGASRWEVVIFGAGHVAQALVRLCLMLPCRLTCVDPRREWLEKLPSSPNLRALCMDEPADFVPQVSPGAFVICMTRGHASDRPILEAIMSRPARPRFVGVIGSRSKAAVLRRELRERGIAEDLAGSFVCPLGLPIGSNHPGEIAVSIAAQLLQERDRPGSSFSASRHAGMRPE